MLAGTLCLCLVKNELSIAFFLLISLQVVLDLTFSYSSNELISVSKDGTIAFWDLNSGERTRVLDVSNLGSSMRTKILQASNGL